MGIFYYQVMIFTLFAGMSLVKSFEDYNKPGEPFFYQIHSTSYIWYHYDTNPDIDVAGPCQVFGRTEETLQIVQHGNVYAEVGSRSMEIHIFDGVGDANYGLFFHTEFDDNTTEEVTIMVNDMLHTEDYFTVTTGVILHWITGHAGYSEGVFNQLAIVCDSTLGKTYAIANYVQASDAFTTLGENGEFLGAYIRDPANNDTFNFPNSGTKEFHDEVSTGNTDYAEHWIVDITEEEPIFTCLTVAVLTLQLEIKETNGVTVSNVPDFITKPGEEITVQCSIPGEPTDVTLSLDVPGFPTNTTSGPSASVSFSVDQSFTSLVAVCSADIDGCAPRTTSTTINNYYPASNETLTEPDANSRNQAQCFRVEPVLQLTCEVAKPVNPLPTVTLEVDDPSLPDRFLPSTDDSDPNVIRYNFQLTPEARGQIHARCVAETPEIPATAYAEFVLNVNEIPATVPDMTVNGAPLPINGIVPAHLGETVTVVCSVSGGNPAVERVNLTCSGESVVTDGTESRTTFEIERSHHQTQCTCSAYHVSQCYSNTKEFEFIVSYPPSVTSFTIDTASQVSQGTEVTFTCEAEGLPAPNICLKAKESNTQYCDQDYQSDVEFYSRKFEMTKSMAPDESDTYMCEVSNSESSAFSSLNVTVLGPVQRIDDTQDTCPMERSGRFDCKFRISIYKPPTHIELCKVQTQGSVTRETVDPSNYLYIFTPKNIRYGEIEIHAFEPHVTDDCQYILKVSNGIGDPLEIGFCAVLAAENQNKVGNSKSTAGLIAVATVSVILLIFIMVMVAYFFYWHSEHTKAVKQKQLERERRTARRDRQMP